MTFDQVIPRFDEWLFGGFILSLIRVALLIAGGFLIAFVVSSFRRGPVEGFYSVAKVVASSVVDFASWSVPRTIAMAMLAVQEAIRRRVLIAFVVFVVIILFAGWYLDVESDNPARLYLSFVLTASNYLVVLLALFLSTFSLPNDIKNRTIYTVVTKPVRCWEIVLGRILGFVTVGTMLLVPMGIVSYFFVQRGLSHDHGVEEFTAVSLGDVTGEGETTFDSHHRHTFKIYELTYPVTSGPTNGQLELTTAPGTAITSFTRDDLDNSRVQYVHDGSETTSDSFDFSLPRRLRRHRSADTGTFNITVTPVNDPPVIAGDLATTVAEGGTVGITTTDLPEIDPNLSGTGETDVVMSHWHHVEQSGEGDSATYEFGPPIGLLQARVPVFGGLRFKDRAGADTEKGINVGHEWAYRSYIEGGTLAAAIWTFEGVTPERYPDGFDLELNLRVFRTYKGDMEKGVLGSFVLRNPDLSAKVRRSEAINFTAKEFVSDKRTIPTSIRVVDNEDGSVRDGNLFDLVDDEGRLEIWIQCGERAQYYGMAERDVYILDRDAPFIANLAKGYIGIWLQMVMVTSFGVMFSTFLSGAVAMMATLSSIVVGYFSNFIFDVSSGSQQGGGPIESLIRIVTQRNVQVDLEIGKAPTTIVEGFDTGFMTFMRALTGMLPDYGKFSTTQYVAYGYNIDGTLLSMQLLTAFSYVFVVSLIAYYLLKTREIAA